MIKQSISILTILLLFTGCSIFSGKKIPKELHFEYDKNDKINYGHSFTFKIHLVYSNGKSKNISSKNELRVEIEGAKYKNGKIKISSYPTSFQKDTIKIRAIYSKDGYNISNSVEIPFNYNGELYIGFKGSTGINGTNGTDGGTSIITGNGKDGFYGEPGGTGGDGGLLTVHIWKDFESKLYFIKVTNLDNNNIYFFKSKDNSYPIKILVNGGTGGKGGKGGDGGDGRDGKVKKDKKKSPGDGGNGSIGGQGGIGGNGGSIYVFIHPNAAEIESRLVIYNYGGKGGKGGNGGSAGRAGKPLEGQSKANEGSAGSLGPTANQGMQGDEVQIIIEEFDIEY